MEKTPENNVSSNSSTHNPAQNELDLGFNQIEPITPKKAVMSEQSMFDKARNMFGRKDSTESTPFSVRKEPTFGEPNLGQQVKDIVSSSISEAEAKFQSEARATTAATTAFSAQSALSGDENAAHTSTVQPQTKEDDFVQEFNNVKAKLGTDKVTMERNMKNPENWAVMQKLPPRHRRLIIAVAATLVVLLVFFWLKPASHTVEDFQAQNTVSQPIEFQPLDQTKIAETATANANDVANMLDNATQPAITGSEITPAETAVPPSQTDPTLATAAEQPETPKTEQRKTEPQTERTTGKQQQSAAATKKATASESNAAANNKVDLPSAAGTKTLTVKQGVSLMQVFRDNNLSVADVNAMTKVKGAENVLSNFKSGDKVQVFLNRQGRVSTLRLSNGATFTRQPDGSYKYTK